MWYFQQNSKLLEFFVSVPFWSEKIDVYQNGKTVTIWKAKWIVSNYPRHLCTASPPLCKSQLIIAGYKSMLRCGKHTLIIIQEKVENVECNLCEKEFYFKFFQILKFFAKQKGLHWFSNGF